MLPGKSRLPSHVRAVAQCSSRRLCSHKIRGARTSPSVWAETWLSAEVPSSEIDEKLLTHPHRLQVSTQILPHLLSPEETSSLRAGSGTLGRHRSGGPPFRSMSSPGQQRPAAVMSAGGPRQPSSPVGSGSSHESSWRYFGVCLNQFFARQQVGRQPARCRSRPICRVFEGKAGLWAGGVSAGAACH